MSVPPLLSRLTEQKGARLGSVTTLQPLPKGRTIRFTASNAVGLLEKTDDLFVGESALLHVRSSSVNGLY